MQQPKQMNTGMEAGSESENVSPEEQRAYEDFVSNGMTVIYDEKAMPALLQAMASASNPIEGLANALVIVVSKLDTSAKRNNVQIDGEIMMHGATEIAEGLVELAEAAQIHEYTEQDMEAAYYAAVDKYRDTKQKNGELDEEGLTQDFRAMQQANEQGALDQMVPGASEAANKLGGAQNG